MNPKRIRFNATIRLIPVVFLLANLPVILRSQTTGTLSGFVADPSGAGVPNATVTATLVSRNMSHTVESNAEGFYNFAALQPGAYSVTVEKTGFERLTQTGVDLSVNQNVRLDFPLRLGTTTQAVTVTGEAPLVDTRSPTLSGLVDDRRVVDLPLNGRNVIQLAATIPGVLSVRALQQLSSARNGPEMDVNGDRPASVASRTKLPTAAQRSGDFSDLPPGSLTNPADTLTGQPFTDSSGSPCVANNTVNPNCISPVATKVLQLVPVTPSNTITTLSASPSGNDLGMGRIDWLKSPKHSLFGHFYIERNHSSNAIARGNIANFEGVTRNEETDMVTVNDTYTFSPTLLNQAVISYLRTTSAVLNTKTFPPSDYGIDLPQYPTNGSFSLSVSGLFSLGSAGFNQFFNNNYQFRDGVSWTRGRHNFKVGGEVLRLHFIQRFLGGPGFSFRGGRSRNAMANFLLGTFSELDVGFGVRDNDDVNTAPSFYLQDEFKMTPRFTLTYGLRYEPYLFWYDSHDRIDTVVIGKQSTKVPDAPPGILFPGDPGIPRTLVPADKNNFAPRLGFAWDVSGNGKTSVRGAYGVFYESVNADSLAQENAPFAGNTAIFNGRIENPFGSLGLAPPPTAPTGKFGCVKITAAPGFDCPLYPLPVGGVFTDLSLRTPYVQSWNLTIQRQITPNVMVEAAYVGKIGTKIEALRTYNPARFIPGIVVDPVTHLEKDTVSTTDNINDRVIFEPGILSAEAFLLGNDFRSWYHSFQTQITRRFNNGLSVKAAYTLSKSIDSSSVDCLGACVSNPFNLRTERGRSDWDRRHAFVVSWLWSPPVKFSKPWMNTAFGNWTFAGITTVQSGPALANTDLSILKDFAFRERYRLQFRTEFFNTFNQVNFKNPDNYVEDGPGTFGAIQSARAARVIQFALKFIW